jgi:hypothetical protein
MIGKHGGFAHACGKMQKICKRPWIVVMHDIGPLHQVLETLEGTEGYAAGSHLKVKLGPIDRALLQVQNATFRIGAWRKYPTLRSQWIGVQANLPDHLLSTPCRIRKICAVDM